MSPRLVIIRWVNPLPGPAVVVQTRLAPTNRSLAFLVITAPLLLIRLLPVAAELTSSGLMGSTPLYSKIRMSAKEAAALNFTVTVLAPATADEMLLAQY